MRNERRKPSREVTCAARPDTAMTEYPKAQTKRHFKPRATNLFGIDEHSINSSKTRHIAVYWVAAAAAFEFRRHLPLSTSSAVNGNASSSSASAAARRLSSAFQCQGARQLRPIPDRQRRRRPNLQSAGSAQIEVATAIWIRVGTGSLKRTNSEHAVKQRPDVARCPVLLATHRHSVVRRTVGEHDASRDA